MEVNYSDLRKKGLLKGTIKAAQAKHEARVLARDLPPADGVLARMVMARTALPLGREDERRAYLKARALHPRRQNWEIPKPSTARLGPVGYSVEDIDNGRYSSRCTYRHWTYRPWVTSYAWLTWAGRSVGWRIWTETGHTKAPRGYRWEKDSNGIKLVSIANPRDDYHPDSAEIRMPGREIAARLRANAATRRAAEKEAKADAAKTKRQQAEDRAAMRRAEAEGARICMADSVRAGNCKAGTARFAERHDLNPAQHYRPTQLLKIANGEAHRVRLAVAVGLRRHRHEMAQGFCNPSDHEVPA